MVGFKRDTEKEHHCRGGPNFERHSPIYRQLHQQLPHVDPGFINPCLFTWGWTPLRKWPESPPKPGRSTAIFRSSNWYPIFFQDIHFSRGTLPTKKVGREGHLAGGPRPDFFKRMSKYFLNWRFITPGFIWGKSNPHQNREKHPEIFGCGSKLSRRGKPQILVHVSTYQGSISVPVFVEPRPFVQQGGRFTSSGLRGPRREAVLVDPPQHLRHWLQTPGRPGWAVARLGSTRRSASAGLRVSTSCTITYIYI